MKKTLILILVGALLGSTVAFAASKFFSDVPSNTWYSEAVASLSDKGIIAGYPDGTFGPTKNVNRAELAVMLDRLIEYMETGQTQEEVENTTTILEEGSPQNEQAQKETPQDQVIQTQVSTEDIRNAFSAKYPSRDYSNYTITIDNNYQNEYVEGGVGAPEGGGAHYWAAKVNGEWIIVKEAQDSVPCSVFEPYNFPQEIIGNDCY